MNNRRYAKAMRELFRHPRFEDDPGDPATVPSCRLSPTELQARCESVQRSGRHAEARWYRAQIRRSRWMDDFRGEGRSQ